MFKTIQPGVDWQNFQIGRLARDTPCYPIDLVRHHAFVPQPYASANKPRSALVVAYPPPCHSPAYLPLPLVQSYTDGPRGWCLLFFFWFPAAMIRARHRPARPSTTRCHWALVVVSSSYFFPPPRRHHWSTVTFCCVSQRGFGWGPVPCPDYPALIPHDPDDP